MCPVLVEPHVDVVVLTRNAGPIPKPVLDGIHSQRGVTVHLHRVIGSVRETDESRWQTIARARNVGRTLGDSPWLMFVDDDVLLPDDCIATLIEELAEKDSSLVALGADYLGERNPNGASKHVAMGATLFRREILAKFAFRCKQDSCECQCMADDLRKNVLEIDHSQRTTAIHLDKSPEAEPSEPESPMEDRPAPIVLTAFDRSHMPLFVGQFLRHFRAHGNRNTVHAVTYGLRPKDVRALERLLAVEVHPHSYTTEYIYRRRMLGFQKVLSSVCPKTPVAYWDAGDVIFQRSLTVLWDLVNDSPDKLLVVEEPKDYPNNIGQRRWINKIRDTRSRANAFELLRGRRIVNGGFIAGAAGLMKQHFEESWKLSNGELLGAGGGDQVILNVLKYRNADRFQVIDETWNYCLGGRSGRECKVRNGRFVDVLNQRTVSVVHGNASTFYV